MAQFQDHNLTNTCEESSQSPGTLPPKRNDSGYNPCPNDASLCCFLPPDAEEGTDDELVGFRLLRVHYYYYRLHYRTRLYADPSWTMLTNVFRICMDEALCADGETPPEIDYPPYDSTRTTTTNTWKTLSSASQVHTASTVTTSDAGNRAVTTLAGGKVATVLPTMIASRAVTVPGITGLVFPTQTPSEDVHEQQPVEIRASLSSSDDVNHLIDPARFNMRTLEKNLYDVLRPHSGKTGVRDVNLTLMAILTCPSKGDAGCGMSHTLNATPPLTTGSLRKFDNLSLTQSMYDTIINKKDPHVRIIFSMEIVCSAAVSNCTLSHTLEADSTLASGTNLFSSGVTPGEHNEAWRAHISQATGETAQLLENWEQPSKTAKEHAITRTRTSHSATKIKTKKTRVTKTVHFTYTVTLTATDTRTDSEYSTLTAVAKQASITTRDVDTNTPVSTLIMTG